MTCIIGIKLKDEFILGCDSQLSIGKYIKEYLNHYSDSKIMINREKTGAIGVCGSASITMLKYTPNLFDDFDKQFKYFNYEYVVNKFIYKVYEELKKLNVVGEEQLNFELPGDIIAVSQNKGFCIKADRFVYEIEDFYAMGSGRDIAEKILRLTKDEPDPLKRIILAMKANDNNTLYVSGDIFYVSTKDYELKKIDDDLIEETMNKYYKK